MNRNLTSGYSDNNRIRFVALLLAVYHALIPLENVLVAGIFGSVSKVIGIVIIGWIVFRHLRSGVISVGNYVFVLLFCLFAVVTSFFSVDDSFFYLSILINMTACTLVFIQVPLYQKEIRLIQYFIIIAGVIISLVMLSGGSATQINMISGGRMTLVLGDMEVDNNNLAVSMSICAVIALSIFYFNSNQSIRTFAIICFIVITIGVFFTGSRGGLIAEVGGLGAFFWKEGKGIKRKKIIIVGFALLFFSFIVQNVLTAGLAERFSIESVISSGGTGRIQIWEHALSSYWESNIFRQLFGYGFGSFGSVLYSHWGYYKASHNDFIGVLLELGVIGEIIFIRIWTKFFKKASVDFNWLAYALLVVVLIGSFSLEMLIKKMLWMVWYLVLVPVIKPEALLED